MSYIIQELLGYAYWSHKTSVIQEITHAQKSIKKGFLINKIQGLISYAYNW